MIQAQPLKDQIDADEQANDPQARDRPLLVDQQAEHRGDRAVQRTQPQPGNRSLRAATMRMTPLMIRKNAMISVN